MEAKESDVGDLQDSMGLQGPPPVLEEMVVTVKVVAALHSQAYLAAAAAAADISEAVEAVEAPQEPWVVQEMIKEEEEEEPVAHPILAA